MSYLVVKQSGSNKSFELKTSVPAKPYMAVKTAVAGTAYLALGTNTTGTGMLVKGNGTNYKVVESYTTTRETSSTYNSIYTETIRTNYTSFASFYSRISINGIFCFQTIRLQNTKTLKISNRINNVIKGVASAESATKYNTALDIVATMNTAYGFYTQRMSTITEYGIYSIFGNYCINLSVLEANVTNSTHSLCSCEGYLASSSEETRQTYSKATSYYTETITVQ